MAALLLALAAAGPAPAPGAGRGADGTFEERRSSHFVLYQDVAIDQSGGFRGSRRFEQQLLDELEGAYRSLDSLLGLRPGRPLEVLVYDPTIFDARFGRLFRFGAAGFYSGVIRVRGDTQLTSRLARVLRHELVHAAFDAAAPSLVLPAWLNEGVAEWFEARTLSKRHLSRYEYGALQGAAEAGQLLSLAQLSVPSFGAYGGGAARLAYLQSYGMIEYLVRRSGERAVRELCRELVRRGNLERALEKSSRLGVAELDAAFRKDLS